MDSYVSSELPAAVAAAAGHGRVDVARRAISGHSMGGKYSVMGLFLEDRLKTAVGLDPTYVGSGDGWPAGRPADPATTSRRSP